MGKKGKRIRNNQNNNKEPGLMGNKFPSSSNDNQNLLNHNAAVRSAQLLKDTLEALSLDRLRSIYLELSPMLTTTAKAMGPHLVSVVTEEDIKNNPNAARQAMQAQIGTLPAGPLNLQYQTIAQKELQDMGGLKVIFVGSRKTGQSFAHTCGFTNVGGKELFLQNIHRSMLDTDIRRVFAHLFLDHKGGKPLHHGSTIACNNLAFVALSSNTVDSTVIKILKTLEPTRLFGIANYDVLEIVPVAVKSSHDNDDNQSDSEERLTHEEVCRMAVFDTYTAKGFQAVHDTVAKLEACSWCHKKRNTAVDKPLMKCSACKNVFYCSRECQRLHWKDHKPVCCRGMEQDDAWESTVKPFLSNLGEADRDEVLRRLEKLGMGEKRSF